MRDRIQDAVENGQRNLRVRELLHSLCVPTDRQSAIERSEARHFPPLACMASLAPGRRRPVKAASREAGARHAPALIGRRRSGSIDGSQARLRRDSATS
jgi:hypothetical protein